MRVQETPLRAWASGSVPCHFSTLLLPLSCRPDLSARLTLPYAWTPGPRLELPGGQGPSLPPAPNSHLGLCPIGIQEACLPQK